MQEHNAAVADRNARQRLMQTILDLGNKAFNPDIPVDNENAQAKKAQARREFDDLIQRTKNLSLIAALNILIRPGYAPTWLRTKLREILTLAPLRKGGVRATLEFVFAVHPSGTVKLSEAAVPQKRGANITHESLTLASSLVSMAPSSVTPEVWYSGIAPQLLPLLDGTEGPELTKAASYIIGFGILGRKATGAPGTAGWKYLAEPMLRAIKPPHKGGMESLSLNDDADEVVDLSKEKVLVKQEQLVTALRRLHSLVVSHPNPGLCKRLLAPLLLPLWALSSWPSPQQEVAEKVCKPAQELLNIFLKLDPSPAVLMAFVRNIGYIGGYDRKDPEWVYKENAQGEIEIVDTKKKPAVIGRVSGGRTLSYTLPLEEIDPRVTKLLDLITSSFTDADISTAFLDLFARWLKAAHGSRKGGKVSSGNIIFKAEKAAEEEQDPIAQLTEMKLLQAMMDKFPDKLAGQPKHILELASQVLSESGSGEPDASGEEDDDDDEVTGVALSLLNMIVTVPGFQKSRVDPDVLKRIETSLDALSKRGDGTSDVAKTANNLSLLLRYRDEIDAMSGDDQKTPGGPTDRQIEDRKTYSLAISYITQQDSPPPVRSEGLNLISELITARSPILDIPGVLVLLSSLMADAEDYINLRVIKMYTLLANNNHPKAVVRELLDRYTDPRELAPSVDARLRFGEALLQVIERLGETFAGPELAGIVGEQLVSLAGRRGHRPKTERRQAKEKKLQELKNREAEIAWDGEVPDMSLDEDLSPEEKARNEILARIVEGWESKRGTEDVRIRASALSILATCVDTNIMALGPAIVSTAVDLCMSILQLEKEPEKGILRRAAVVLVLSFVKAMDKVRRGSLAGGGFGFGTKAQEDVERTLRYVAQTDEDGLVRQHAEDVVESLESWKMGSLVMPQGDVEGSGLGTGFGMGGGLTKLAGLVVDPERSSGRSGGGAGNSASGPVFKGPRIEEIE